jgi:CRP/FNR family transcriptional regulator/CRP/FNR family cyclic AMP-dependent transcriptional regulator
MADIPQSAIKALQAVPFFAQLTSSELHELSRSLVRRRFNASQTIFHLGDPGGLLYIVDTGKVKIYYPNAEGQEVTLAILGQNDFFGELALFDDEPRSATAETLEPTYTYTLAREEFIRYVGQNPDFAMKVMSTLAKRIRAMNEQISDVFFLDLPGRLARKLLQLAEDHGEPVADGIYIPLHLTQTDLAEMTGATRVSVNKALRRFRKQGWVSVAGRRFTVHDPAELKNLIQLSGG